MTGEESSTSSAAYFVGGKARMFSDNQGHRISVVIPAYNEAKNLPHVLPLIPDWVHEIILVNDHSTDDTVEVARRLLPNIRIFDTQRGRGKGAAMQTGFAVVTGDIVVMMDADGSSDPREIQRFVEVLLAGADFAKGSRFIEYGGGADITFLRKMGNWALTLLVNLLFRVRFTDLCYGYNAFWKDCLYCLQLDCDGFEIETVLNLRAHKSNLKIVEVSSYEHRRIHGISNLHTFLDGKRVLKVILKEWKRGHSQAAVSIHRPYQGENVAGSD